jgi:hypothetical protein
MLFREIITVYSENHMKSTNKLHRQNAGLLIREAAINTVTAGFHGDKTA